MGAACSSASAEPQGYSRCRYVTMLFAFSGWFALSIRHETELSWGLLVAYHLLTDPVALRSLADTCSKLGTGSECQCAAATPLAWFLIVWMIETGSLRQ